MLDFFIPFFYVCCYWLIFFVSLKLIRFAIGFERVDRFVNRFSLTLGLGYVHWQTTRFNHNLSIFGRKYSSLIDKWFSIGAVVGISCLIISVFVLLYALMQALFTPTEKQLLTPVIPGINVPNNHLLFCKSLIYYWNFVKKL